MGSELLRPDIAVIILNWNNTGETLGCLEQIRSVNYPAERMKVVVVDNGSTQDSIEALRSLPAVHLIELPTNLGFAGGTNAGIRFAIEHGSEYVLILNNDTILEPGFLLPLVQTLEDNPRCGIVAPKICYAEPSNRIWYAGGRFFQPRILGELIGQGQQDDGRFDQPATTGFATGCCMLVRKNVFEQIGFLDDRLFFYHEDVDFSYRAGKAGFTIWYQPASKIYHKVGLSTRGDLPGRTRLYARARMVFLAKHIHGWKIPLVVFMEIIRLIRFILGTLFTRQPSQASAYVRGIWEGGRDAWQTVILPSPAGTGAGTRQSRFEIWKRLIGMTLGLVIFTYLAVKAWQGVRELSQTDIQFNWKYLVLSLAIHWFGTGLAGAVWGDILHRLGVKSRFWFNIQSFCVSSLARKIPGTVWYAVSRIAIYKYIDSPASLVIIALIIEAIMFTLAGMVNLAVNLGSLSNLPAWLNPGLTSWLVIPLVVLAFWYWGPALVRWAVVRYRRDQSPVTGLPVQISRWDSLRWLVGQSTVIFMAACVYFFLFKAIDHTAVISLAAVSAAFSLAVVLGPVTIWLPGDIGLRDGFIYLALLPFTSAQFAALATLAGRLWVSISEISLGLISAYFLSRNRKEKSITPP